MNNSKNPSERFVNAVRTYPKACPQLLSFRQPVPAGHPSRNFVVPVFLSVVIHAFLAFQLWVVVTDRTVVEPATSTIDTPLILSLSTFTTDSHDGMDLKVVSAVLRTDPPAERKSEAETVVASIGKEIPASEAPEDKSPATDATPSFDLEAAYNMAWDFGIKPVFEAETSVTSKGQGISGSEAPESKSLTTCLTPLSSLEDFYCIEQEFGRMSESEIMEIKIKPRMLYVKNYLAEARALHPDCGTAFMNNGLFAIPLLIKSAITGNDCKWWPKIKEIE